MNAVGEDWDNGSWGWTYPQALTAPFLCPLDSEGFAPTKKTTGKVKNHNPVPPVQTRNRYTHLAGIGEEEEADEDTPLCMVQCEVATEPHPARNDLIQDQTTGLDFRTGGKFTELGLEDRRLAERRGG